MTNDTSAVQSLNALTGVVDAARKLVPAIRERSDETTKLRRVSNTTITELADAGLFGLLKPKAYGGQEADFGVFVDVILELAQGDCSVAWVYSILSTHELFIGHFPSEAQDDIWRDHPDTLCAASFMPAGIATPVTGGFRLSGQWGFCSGIDNAQWMLLGARFGEHADTQEPDIRFVLLPRDEGNIVDDWHVIGLEGTGSKSFSAKDAFVPEHRVLSFADASNATTPGARMYRSPIFKTPIWALFPYSTCCPPLGAAKGALGSFMEQMSQRRSVFDNEKLSALSGVQMHLAEAAALIDGAELLLKRDVRETMDAAMTGVPLTLEHRVRNRRDHGYMIVMLTAAVENLFKANGGRGIYLSNHVQRVYRDVQAAGVHVGTSWHVTGRLYGQVMMGGPPTTPIY